MKRVYIAGPISKGDLARNLNQATAAFVALAKAGLAPLCPHWSAYAKPCVRQQFFGKPEVWCQATVGGNGEIEHADWLSIDLAWLSVSDAVLRLPGESVGADEEVAEANRRGLPVFYSVADVIAWAQGAKDEVMP